jgi:dimethylaniline monooxygenase (N-oxide forming)
MKKNNKNVLIIGAGLSGLVTAKVLLEDGFEVTVYEKAKGMHSLL